MAWGKVQTSVNATSVVPRSMDEVRKKWDDVKRLTKKRAAGVRKDQTLTGGGERSIVPLTNTEEILVSLIGEERIYGIPDGKCAFQQQLKITSHNYRKERLSTEKKRLTIEEDRLRLERERLEELKKISGILLRRNTIRSQFDSHLDVPSKSPTTADKTSSQYGEPDYSYMYASLLLD
ncbi:NAIF1 [Mytilus coruscus]|uniref:NAIF1 n=1 Tax=Mytilus coruscus TaxID=42192 RepID=A0A6J8AL94_MYTCO|nr:NAIF1 [Mytilus coruscus]